MNEELKGRFSEAVKLKDGGNLSAAKALLEKLAVMDKKSPAIFAVLGDVCWDMKLLREASIWFQRAVDIAPKLEAVSLGLFHCLWELGERECALAEAKRFTAITGSHAYSEIVLEINGRK